MMLEALVAFAEREGLLEDTSFVERPVNFRLRIAADGRPLALEPLGDDGRGVTIPAPTPPKRTVAIAPAFLVDNAQYALGLPKRKKGKPPDDKAVARAPECLRAFALLVGAARDATGDAGLGAVSAFLDRVRDPSVRDEVLAMAKGHEWTGDENLAFALDADGSRDVHVRPDVRAYWSKQRAGAGGDTTSQRCLVTGVFAPPVRLHDVIKKIPEAQSSGASLVSFNAAAFTSHGFDQGANAPVSQRAADGYVRALNHMLDRDGERRRFRNGVAVGPDAVTLFWTREDDPTADVLVDLFAPEKGDEDEMRAVLEAAWKGLAAGGTDGTPFYALTLGGNASRVVVRDWIETTAGRVKANVRRYFDDLALDGEPEPLPIGRLLRALEATPSASSDKRGLTPALASRLLRAALQGSPFPRELLHAALARLRVPPRDAEWRGTLRARVGLIKATLIRLHSPHRHEVTVSLDPNNESVPYLLGRLFAAIEYLQGAALGDVNATIRDRYFGAASSTPAFVFPRLLRVSVHHASKAERDGRGWAERLKGEIVNRLPATRPFPTTLGLEAQGLFAVGYYHQRQAFFTKREGAEPTPEEAAT